MVTYSVNSDGKKKPKLNIRKNKTIIYIYNKIYRVYIQKRSFQQSRRWDNVLRRTNRSDSCAQTCIGLYYIRCTISCRVKRVIIFQQLITIKCQYRRNLCVKTVNMHQPNKSDRSNIYRDNIRYI